MKAKLFPKLIYVWSVALTLLFNSLFVVSIIGQEIDQVKEQIFKEAKETLQKARDEGVPLLSPNNFAKANEFYQKAIENYNKGEKLKKIHEDISYATEHLQAAFEAAKLSRIVLKSLLHMRSETTELGILRLAPDNFSQAERKFREAIAKVEEGNLKSAKSIAKNAEKEYRKATIETLKKVVLENGKKKLKGAKDTVPKESYRKAATETKAIKNFIEKKKEADFAIGELFNDVQARIDQALRSVGIEGIMPAGTEVVRPKEVEQPGKPAETIIPSGIEAKVALSMDEEESQINKYLEITGNWHLDNIDGNNVIKTEGSGLLSLRGVEPYENIYLEHDFTVSQGSYRVYFKITDDAKYALVIRRDGILLEKELPGNERIVLGSAEKRIDEEQHNIRICMKSKRIIVLLDQLIVFNILDPKPIAHGGIVFWASSDSRLWVDNIKIVVKPRSQINPGEYYAENFENESLLCWDFSENIRFGAIAYNKVLLFKGQSEAAMHIVPLSKFYTIKLSYILGSDNNGQESGIILHSTQNEMTAYKLMFVEGRLVFVQIKGGEEKILEEKECQLQTNYVHDVAIYMLGDYFQLNLDGKCMLSIEDFDIIKLSTITFYAHLSQDNFIGINNMQIRALDAFVGRGLIEYLTKNTYVQKVPKMIYPSIVEERLRELNVIPLKVEVYDAFYTGKNRTFIDGTINPGPVPPNFVHTWAIDVKNMEKFNLHFKEVNLAPNDIIKVFVRESFLQKNAQGQYLPPLPIMYATGQSSYQLTIDLTNPVIHKNGIYNKEDIEYTWNGHKKTYKRIYIQLETSEKKWNRKFVIDGLESLNKLTLTEEALLVGDNIRYDKYNPGSVIQVEDVKLQMGNKPIKLIKPLKKFWIGQVTHPKPERKDGWYLLGQILKDEGQGFFALAYYNERKSKVRVYLYNYGVKLGTGYSVRFSLVGLFKNVVSGYSKTWLNQFEELKGAIFPMHPNPLRWSDCVIVLPGEYSLKSSDPRWSYNSWISVEIPMLIPMVEKIPAAKPSPYQFKKSPYGNPYYRSVYDERFRNDNRNVLFKIQVSSYDIGKINAHLIAKAIGQAMQGKSSNFATEMNQWLTDGYSISKEATDTWNSIKVWSKQEESKTSITDFLSKGGDVIQSLVSIGSGIFSQSWGSVFSGLGSLGKTIYSLFQQPQILKLGIELDLQGILKGKMIIKSTPQEAAFFLPGRFSIEEAFRSGIQMENQALVNSLISRYDRRLGLFGYIYNPGDVFFNIFRYHLMRFRYSYPTQFKVNPNYVPLKYSTSVMIKSIYIDYSLPVIYNPYGEIVPIKPVTVGNPINLLKKPKFFQMCSIDDWYLKHLWTYDISWIKHVIPEPDDSSFPLNYQLKQEAWSMRVHVYGYQVTCSAGEFGYASTPPYGTYMQVLPKIDYIPMTFHSFKEVKFLKVDRYYVGETWNNPSIQNPNLKSNSSIDDVIYFWDQPYFYYSRSRKDNTGKVPRSYEVAHFRSPVTIRTMDGPFPITSLEEKMLPSLPIYVNRSNSMKMQ